MAWTRRGVGGKLLWLGLLPFSLVFRTIVFGRNRFYHAGWFKSSQLPRPVVSVGNLTVGGTGKTPTTIWLTAELGNLGHRVAILSRGYGSSEQDGGPGLMDPARAKSLLEGSDQGSVPCADEPLMMSAVYGYTVGVARKRYEMGLQLCQQDPMLGAFVLDDGFQHRQLARGVDVVLLGRECQGSMLPAGPFREPLSALERADAVLVTAAHDEWKQRLEGRCDTSKLFFGELQPRALVTRVDRCWSEVPLGSISGAKILAVSAIANPASFYGMLEDWDAEIVDSVEFPDHHAYTTEDWQEISRRGHRVEKIVTTEKDLVKLVRYPFATGFLFALRVEMVLERREDLLDRITTRLFGN